MTLILSTPLCLVEHSKNQDVDIFAEILDLSTTGFTLSTSLPKELEA